MKNEKSTQSGQSVILISFALIALLALVAVVVDSGNAYVQRRQMVNAVDAAAQAGSVAAAQKMNNGQVLGQVNYYLQQNGVNNPGSTTQAYYVGQDAGGNTYPDTANPIASLPQNQTAPTNVSIRINGQWVQLPVVGVSVQGNKTFDTFFAGMVGWRQMTVGGGTTSYAMCGASQADTLAPIAIASTSFQGGVIFKQTNPTWTYQLNEGLTNQALNYVYVSWNSDTSKQTLVNNLRSLDSGTWSTGDSVAKVSDTMASDSSSPTLYSVLSGMDTSNKQVTVPVYDTYNSQNHTYHIQGFVRIQITAVHKGNGGYYGDYGYLQVQVLLWTDPTGQGGGPNYGVCAVKTHQDTPNPQRILTGSISLQKISLNYTPHTDQVHAPVDVVNVLDISGSMDQNFGGKSKLAAAQQALTSFDNNLQPDQGDRIALVTFPKIQSKDNDGHSGNYSMKCSSSYYSTYYYANRNDALTANVAGVNQDIANLNADGGTPLAGGLQVGLQTVLGTGHQTNHTAVMIVASDGIANVLLNTKWTGFSGSTYDPPSNGCNDPAEQDALAQANIAKGDFSPSDGKPDIIVFSIAIGNDFNSDLLKAIATPDTQVNKGHFFTVTDAASMASIYDQISNRVEDITSETCDPTLTTAFAGGASVTIKNLRTLEQRTLATTSTGEFVWPDADYGTYEVESASVSMDGYTYDVLTKGIGGTDLSASNLPQVDVGQEDGTYKTDVFLRNSTPLHCAGN